MVGIFENSFHLANWENSHKRISVDEDKEEQDDKQDEDDKDDRKKRVNKKIDSYSIECEKGDALQTEKAKFWRVCAQSTEYARFLANTRGSVGTPEWMEDRIKEIVKDNASVKEVRVLNSDQL